MRKKIVILSSVLVMLLPIKTNAAQQNGNVGYDMSAYECTSKYQDRNISTDAVAYFSHCIKAVCQGSKYKLTYYDDEKINCLNGNTSPYYELHKNGCDKYNTKSCSNNSVNYCSLIMKYDCSRKQDGSPFKTTTTTKKKTTRKTTKRITKKTTTTTTTTVAKSNTNLKALVLSNGSIMFNSNTYSYNVEVDSTVSNINVTAVPEDNSSKVNVSGNNNITNGSVITVTVTGTDNSVTEYKINVSKKAELSSNNKLKSLVIEGFDIEFDSNKNTYDLVLSNPTSSLNINYEVEDDKASVEILDNSNLEDGSKITINVTAEDESVNNYYINIIVKKKSSSLKIIFLIVVIVALLAGGYYVYKKFIASKLGEKYEYE